MHYCSFNWPVVVKGHAHGTRDMFVVWEVYVNTSMLFAQVEHLYWATVHFGHDRDRAKSEISTLLDRYFEQCPLFQMFKTINLSLPWDLRISRKWLWSVLSFWIWPFVVLVEACCRFEGSYYLFLLGGRIYLKCGRLADVASQKATFFVVVSPFIRRDDKGTDHTRMMPLPELASSCIVFDL